MSYGQQPAVAGGFFTRSIAVVRDAAGTVPDHRRKGVGTKLIAMAILEGRARSLEFMVTVLRESNLAAQHFFHACGFQAGNVVGPLKGWFGSEGGIAMRRPVVLPSDDLGVYRF